MKVRGTASWILALALAGALIFVVGLPKFIGPSPNPIFALLAGRSGLIWFEPYVRYAIGAAELLASVALVVPRTRRFGAAIAGAVTLGAIGFHLSPWLGIKIPEMGRLVAELRSGKTVAEIDAMNLPNDGGMLFFTAIVFLVTAIAIFILSAPDKARQA
jgi:uncharacterized membrane protein YphA (DoxX/SURF4 family)